MSNSCFPSTKKSDLQASRPSAELLRISRTSMHPRGVSAVLTVFKSRRTPHEPELGETYMSEEKTFLTGPMLPSVLAGVAGHTKRRVGDLADGSYESLSDMKERTVLAVGDLNRSTSDVAKDLQS